MANNFAKNFTTQIARIFLKECEARRTLSKNVNTTLLEGRFSPRSGTTVEFKRPTDFLTSRTTGGDLTSETASDIVTATATGTVQDMFTVFVEYDIIDEALKMDQKGRPGESNTLLGPMAQRLITDFELDFASYMMKNSGLLAGTTGNAVNTWAEVAEAAAVLRANGVPADDTWCYAMNPYTEVALASAQTGLSSGDNSLVNEAWRDAIVKENFAGLRVMSSTTLASFTTGAGSDRTGALTANPDVTYATNKNTMTQSLALGSLDTALPIKAGDIVQIAGRYRLNQATREPIVDETGAKVLWTGVVTADVTASGGAATVVVTGPAIYESGGAFNTVDSAPVSGDVVTILGSASTTYQPNLFWHKQAFGIGSVKIPPINAESDTYFTTKDGIIMRVSMGGDWTKNQNKVRIDFLPAYATFNPFFAGHGYGAP